MAGSVNKVILVGNLGRDPEIRSTQDGMRIANLNLATSESWRDRASGERKERTEWHRVVIFNERLAEIAEKYLKKGAKIYVEGQLQTRKWQDQQGQDRYSTEVVLTRFRGELTMLDGAGGAVAAAARPARWTRAMTRPTAAADPATRRATAAPARPVVRRRRARPQHPRRAGRRNSVLMPWKSGRARSAFDTAGGCAMMSCHLGQEAACRAKATYAISGVHWIARRAG